MSKRTLEFFLLDILIAIDKIGRYCRDAVDAQAFYHDEKSFDATMRELQIIGEAAKHLIRSELLNSDYQIIVDFRNVIVHEYFGVDADEIWDIIHQELPSFQDTVQSLIPKCDKETFMEITRDTQSDYQGETKKFLIQLYQEISKA